MPLSIGVSRGTIIYVDENVVEVTSIVSSCNIFVSVNGAKPISITDQKTSQILPEVFVQTGGSGKSYSRDRLAFSAPKHIKIGRNRDYKRSSEESIES